MLMDTTKRPMMKDLRSGVDRRGTINRRQMRLAVEPDRRVRERRRVGERRASWVRNSEWSSVDLDLLNRYFWEQLKPPEK